MMQSVCCMYLAHKTTTDTQNVNHTERRDTREFCCWLETGFEIYLVQRESVLQINTARRLQEVTGNIWKAGITPLRVQSSS